MNRLSFSVFIQFVLFTMGFSFIKQRPQSPLPFIESPKSNGTQLSSNLYINEFMASNVLAYPNNEGNYEDWIEIYNSGDAPVDLAGYFLTDNTNSNNYWKIPAGNPSKTTILAKGYLIFYADEQPIAGAEHLAFKLNKEGGQICLIDKDGLTLLDNLIYQKQVRDISFGRYPDGSSVIGYFAKHTPAASNIINYLSI
ncbi:MAG: lamin tail domain-containing protein, partial [Methanococcaceae archaeon]